MLAHKLSGGQIMNIAAFILALAGSALSMLQPVISIPYLGGGFSILDFLTSNLGKEREFFIMGCIALAIAILGVVSGINILKRKGGGTGVTICGLAYVLVIVMILSNSKAEERMFVSMVFSWQKTFLVWARGYFAAAVCASIDQSTEHPETTTYSSPSVPSSAQQPQAPKPAKTFEPVIGVETEALIKRAKIFLSDGDFNEAERYYEQALRQDPENSQAYLGKLMAQCKVHNVDELSNISSSLSENKLFKRALEFANDEEKLTLQKCLDDNATRLEALKQEEQKKQEIEALEKKYDEATHAKRYGEDFHNIDSLKRAQKMFEELGDYKDSKSLVKTVEQQIVDEEERKEGFKKVTFITVLIVIGAVIIIMLKR